MVMGRNLVKVGNREVKKRYIGNKLIFEDLPDKTELLSGEEIFTDKADDSVVHVEVDGKSYQHAGSGKNLFDIRHHTYSSTITPNEWGGFDRSGGYGGITGSEIKVEPNQTYTFSYKVEYGSVRQEIYDGDGSILYSLGTSGDVSFTPKHSIISINVSNASVYNDVDSRITEIQLEKGSVATEYEPLAPNPDYPIEIHSLNDFDVVSQKPEGGMIDGVEVGGRNYFVVANMEPRPSAIDRWRHYTFKVEPNQLHTLSIHGAHTGRTFIVDEIEVWFNEARDGYQFSSNSDGIVTVAFWDLEDLPLIDGTAKIKLEKGNKATDWTPAPEDISESDNHPLIDKINLSLSEPLRSVYDVKDRLFRDSDGLWKIERSVGEEVFENGDKWNNDHMLGGETSAVYGISSYNANYMKERGIISLSHVPNDRIGPGTDENEGWLQTNPRLRIRLQHSVIGTTQPSASAFKDWLKKEHDNGTPLTIVYELAEPTIEILDQDLQDKLNNLRSFQDSNYVYTIINGKTDISSIVAENLKPTLHTTFKSKGWYDYYLKTLLK